MKKLLTVVVLVLSAMSVSAQEEKSSLTLYGGAGMSSVVGSDADTKAVLAYKVGISYDLALSESFSVIPGAEFVTKGYKSDAIDGNISMSYLQIPILATYKLGLSDDMKLCLKAGPYLAYGLFGSDIEWYGGGSTNIFDSDGGFNRFDAGVSAGASIVFDEFEIGIQYSRGLTKLDSDYKQYNQAYGLVVGYKF